MGKQALQTPWGVHQDDDEDDEDDEVDDAEKSVVGDEFSPGSGLACGQNPSVESDEHAM